MRVSRYLAALALTTVLANAAAAELVLSGGGLVLAEQGGGFDVGNLAELATPFALDELDFGVHFIAHLNDLSYGNSNSWIGNGDTGTSGPFVGVGLGAATTTVQSIAFGRDNLGQFAERWQGLYTLQYTQVANPDASTGDQNWIDVGTLDYQSPGGPNFGQPALRHRFNFDPVEATGVRLMVPGTGLAGGTCIDEIELYADPGVVFENPPIVLAPEPGFSITWDENEGDFFDENAPPLQVGAPNNAALAAGGATAFGSSQYGAGVHLIANANDGYYGNSNSWLGILDGTDPEPFIGIDFDGIDPVAVDNVAFGRDNGNNNPPGTDPGPGGVLVDRWQGLYTLQYTLLADPDASTTETGDANTGWANVGTIELARQGAGDEPLQQPWLRHQFDVSTDGGGSILATGIRILAPQGNCIDEIEINSAWLLDLTWDVAGHVDLTWEGGGNWTPGAAVPNTITRATIPADNPDTITVGTTTAEAYSLMVEGGQVAIDAGGKLSITSAASFAPGTTLRLGAGATFSAGQGDVGTLSTDGDATIEVTGSTLTVDDVINTNPGSLTKQGPGTLSISGENPLDGYSPLILGGGTLDVSVLLNGAILDELDMSPSWLDPADPHYPGFPGGAIDEPGPGDGTYHGPSYLLPATVPPEFTFTMTPRFLGTNVTVDTSWGVSFNHTIDVDYFFDPDGPGPEAEIPLVEDIRQTSWNDQLTDIDQAAGVDWSGFLEVGSGLDLTAESQFRVTGTLAGGAYPEALTSGVWRFALSDGVADVLDLTGTDVKVVADSTLRLSTIENAAEFGSLTLESGILTNAGVQIGFAGGTTIDAAADAVVGVNLQSDIDPGVINVLGDAPVTFVKAGPLDLVMTAANVGAGFGNLTFDVQEGRLIGLHGSNPFDLAALRLGGGELVLSSAGGDVLYDNALSVTESGTLTAGAAGGGVAEELTVTLGGTPDNGLSIDAGKTLTLLTTDGYSLDIAAAVDGPQGSVRVEQGTVTFTGGGSVANLRIPEGVTAGIDAGIDADRALAIGQTLRLGTISLEIDQGSTFSVSGPDLLAGGNVVLSGGTLTIANGAAPSPIVVPAEALALTGGIELVEERGEFAAGNLAAGGTPFAGAPLTAPHTIEGLNDLLYGNSYSWIGAEGAAPIAGISLGASPIGVASIAFGRDNADSHPNGGPYQDRWAGLYTLQYTQVPNPNETTGDESWIDVGTLNYIAADGEGFAEPMVRHRYVFDPVQATGIRLVVPGVGWPGAVGTCIDEIELYGGTTAPIVLPATHFEVTADTTLSLDTDLDAALGNLALADGVTLSLTGAAAGFQDVRSGRDGRIVGNVTIKGTLAPGDGPALLTVAGNIEFSDDAVYKCEIGEWDSPGGLPPQPPLPDPPADLPINDRINISGGDIYLGGTLELTATAKLHPRVPHPDPPHVEVQWYGDQTRVIAGAGGEYAVSYTFTAVPDPQPESWDNILTGTPQWSRGHIGRGVFLTRRNDGGPDDVPGISYTPSATKLHLFQACDGDTNGDRTLGGRDIQNIQSFALFGITEDPGPGFVWPPDWSQGDFDGDGLVTGLDISAILATGLWPTAGYAAIEPGTPLDGVVDLLLYPEDVTLEGGTVVPAGTVMIDPDGLTLNGYVLRSESGIFTGAPAQQLNWFFVEDTDRQISGNMGATIVEVQDLGAVVGPEWTIINPFDKQDVNPFDDVTFTYTVVGTPGTFVGNLIIVPEPSTLVMLIGGTLGLLLLWRRRRAS